MPRWRKATEPDGRTGGRKKRRPGYYRIVISPEGHRAAKIVAGLRLASAAAMVVVLTVLGGAFSTYAATGEVASWRWGVAVGALLAAGLFGALEIGVGGAEARREEKRVRAELLTTVFNAPQLPDQDETENGSGRLIQLMTDNTERLTEYRQVFYGTTLATMIIPFAVLGYVTVAIDPVVGLVTVLLCPLIPLLLFAFMRLFRKTSANSRSERAQLSDRYLDAISNLVPIRMLGAGTRIEAQLRDQGEANRGAIMKLLAGNQLVIIALDGLFSLVLICASTGLAVARMSAGAIDLGQALSVVFLTILLIEPLTQVAAFFYIGMGGMASERAIGRYLATERGRTARAVEGSAPGDRAVASPGLALQLSGLRHDHGRGEVLHGIDLSVPRGDKVAIVGRSGAGKSTLLGLIRGSVPLQQGSVFVDGIDIAGLEPATIRELTATVSQTTWLFTGTIADNLRVARPDATDDELWDALRRAHLAQDVEQMPHGLDTDAGERGGMLSGGQAQRISLARALLSGRRILLLDEPTSQVDLASEAHIVRAIAEIGRDHTVLVATHRRALLDVMDATFEMTDGTLTPLQEGAPA